MLRAALIASSMFISSAAIAADTSSPPPAPSVTVTVKLSEVQIIERALRIAASQCGASSTDGCVVGLNEAAIDAELQAAKPVGK